MPTWIPLSFVSLALAAVAQAGTPEVFVDPVAGVDAPTQGSQSAPYRSIRYALAQNPGPIAVSLAAGTYTTPLESFPLTLGAGDLLRGPQSGGARIRGTGSGVNAPHAVLIDGGDGSGVVQLEHVVLESAGGSPLLDVDARPAADGSLVVQMRDCKLVGSSRGMRLRTAAGVSPAVVLDCTRVDVRALAQAFELVFASGTVGFLRFDHCFVSGQTAGVSVRVQGGASGPATVFAEASRTVFERSSPALMSRSDGNGSLSWIVDSCVLTGSGYAVCAQPLVPGPGAVLDFGSTVAGNLTYAITRSVFWTNWPGCAPDPFGAGLVADLGSYRAADYVVDRNVIQQPAPAAGWNGVNVSGDPRFFQYSPTAIGSNDYHVLAGSPAIDWGGGPPNKDDFEGDPVVSPCGDGTSDAGVDEHRPVALWLAPRPKLGTTSELRMVGPALGWAVVYGGVPLGTSTCDGSLGIAPLFPMALLVPIDAAGTARVPLAVPTSPSLLGLDFAAQGFFATPEGNFGGLTAVREYALEL
ncbi:MAG: DUF1565 domain-containing protein [Planctomycetaceae bacterium]|nr:DUF1565 domain-containing protein [Planctomycetaceae bacterium]